MEATAETRPDGRTGRWIELYRHFDAPRALVFNAWSDAIHLRRWCAPDGMRVTDAGADFREGGLWHVEMTAEDGAVLVVGGEYLAIGPGRRIVHSHGRLVAEGPTGPRRRVEVTLSDEGEGTGASFRMGPFDEGTGRDRHRLDWIETLDRLGAYLPEMIIADPAPATEPVIRLTRVLAHSPAHVWTALSDPASLGRWWTPEGFVPATHAFDLCEGGHWHFTLRGPDGREYPNRIRFVTADPGRRLAYRHLGEDGTDDAVFDGDLTLSPIPVGTRLTLTMRFGSVEVRNNVARTFGAIEGGQVSLARLAALLAKEA